MTCASLTSGRELRTATRSIPGTVLETCVVRNALEVSASRWVSDGPSGSLHESPPNATKSLQVTDSPLKAKG